MTIAKLVFYLQKFLLFVWGNMKSVARYEPVEHESIIDACVYFKQPDCVSEAFSSNYSGLINRKYLILQHTRSHYSKQTKLEEQKKSSPPNISTVCGTTHKLAKVRSNFLNAFSRKIRLITFLKYWRSHQQTEKCKY